MDKEDLIRGQFLLTDVVMPINHGLEAYEEMLVTVPDLEFKDISGYASNMIYKKW